MEGDHRLSHVVTSGVRIEAAVDLAALRQQRRQPSWVGPSTGSGEAVVLGMQSKATDGVDGGLTENDLSVGRTVAGRPVIGRCSSTLWTARCGCPVPIALW